MNTSAHHMLQKHIEGMVSEVGYITLEQFMSIAIPYYYEHHASIGADGDFITSPEISPIFGLCLANWIERIATKDFAILELGGGNGTLAHDILSTITPNHYYIYDSSSKLKAIQKEKLRDFKQVYWINDFATITQDKQLVIIANEFFDAFPIRQFTKHDDEWYETIITFNENKLIFGRKRTNLSFPNREIVEISQQTHYFIEDLIGTLKPHAMLFIDYGYNETLNYSSVQALKNHQPIHPLQLIGEADITAHVDFQSVKNLTSKHGYKSQVTTQKEFLNANAGTLKPPVKLTDLNEMGSFLVNIATSQLNNK